MVKVMIGIKKLGVKSCEIGVWTDESEDACDNEKRLASLLTEGISAVLDEMGKMEKSSIGLNWEKPSEELKRRVRARFEAKKGGDL